MQELENALRRSSAQGVIFGQTVANTVGISGSDLECLDFLNLEGRVTAGRLAEVTGLTTGAITGVVDRLEKAGLVRRERDPADRRKVFIATVPENIAKVGRFYEHMQRGMVRSSGSPIRTPNCGLLLEFASKGYETMLAATEELKSMVEAPKENAHEESQSKAGRRQADLGSLRGHRERGIGARLPAFGGGEHAPHGAQHHPEVPPMVGIDDEALADGAEEGREDRQIGRLPGHADEDIAEARQHGDEDQRRIADAGEPAARHECVQVGIVGVFGKEAVELQRPDAERQAKRHFGAEKMPAETAEAA